jgi:ribosome-binding protein aMBF1 (putative translation factor)
MAGQTFDHQDWTPVVFKKKSEVAGKKPVAFTASLGSFGSMTTNQNKNAILHGATARPAWKIEQQVDDENAKSPIPFISKIDTHAVIQGRVSMKLTQKELAQRLNMQEREIKDIERGAAVENKAKLSKIKRFLNIM